MKHATQFAQLAAAAKSHIKEIDVTGVKQKLDRKENFLLVDVREDSEWSNGHLPNAIHLSKGVIERDIEGVIPNTNTEIVLYCGGGFRSALAAENLLKMGYTQVLSLAGGFRAWIEAGYDIE